MHDDRAVVDVHVQGQLLFEQFHVLGAITVMCGGMKYRPAAPMHVMDSSSVARGCFVVVATY